VFIVKRKFWNGQTFLIGENVRSPTEFGGGQLADRGFVVQIRVIIAEFHIFAFGRGPLVRSAPVLVQNEWMDTATSRRVYTSERDDEAA